MVWCSNGAACGGMERAAITIANGLTRRLWEVTLVAPFGHQAALRRAIESGVDFVDCEYTRTAAGLYSTQKLIRQLIRDKQIDAVSAHGSIFPILFCGVPVVWTEHDVRYEGLAMLAGVRGLPWRRVRDLLLKGRWSLVSVSQFVHEATCALLRLPTSSGSVIHNGLPHAESLNSLDPPSFTPPYRVGYLGRLDPSKRPLEVFAISRELCRIGLPHVWHVFGDGLLRPEMELLAMRSEHRSVVLRGPVATPDEALASLDILCFHSQGAHEGLPTVLLEAAAANRRVVAWDTAYNREALRGRGTLVPQPNGLRSFARAIAEAARAGPEKLPLDQSLTSANMIRAYERLLENAIGPGK